jgi:hypothetical protein
MMIHSGTAKVGIRLSGSIPIDAIGVAGAKNPSEELLVSTPVVNRPDEVEQATEVEPERAPPPVWMAVDHGEQHEHRCDADRHVAQPRREREQRRAQVERVEKQEHAAEDPPGLHGGEQPQIEAEREAPKLCRNAIGDQECPWRHDERGQQRQRRPSAAGFKYSCRSSHDDRQQPNRADQGEQRHHPRMLMQPVDRGRLISGRSRMDRGCHCRLLLCRGTGGRQLLQAAPQGAPRPVADPRHHLRLSPAPERQRPREGSAPGRSQTQIAFAPVGPAVARHKPVALERRHISRQRGAVHDQPFSDLAQRQSLADGERPEALSSAAGMRAAGRSYTYIFLLWSAIAIGAAVAIAAGYVGFGSLSEAWPPRLQAFGAGALLAMTAETMTPEAFHNSPRFSGLLAAFGFGILLLVDATIR